jgi:hypothetical protein
MKVNKDRFSSTIIGVDFIFSRLKRHNDCKEGKVNYK